MSSSARGVGLSTYSFFWRRSDRVEAPLDLPAMIRATAEAGAGVLQLCDEPGVEAASREELAALRAAALAAGIDLELGVRGVRRAQLARFLELAEALGARLVRTMLGAGEDRPSVEEAIAELGQAVPRYAAAGVTLALETYEAYSTADLLSVVEAVDDPHVGVCLDPANQVARLERPRETVELVAGRVANLHVKDFCYVRSPGLVGFSLTGCPLGSGLLDLDHLYRQVRPNERGISQIVEHWLPWQGEPEATVRLEEQWTATSLAGMRARRD